MVARLERVDAAVLEEAAEHTAHRYALAHARDARPQHADPTRDDLDGCAGRGGVIERVDDLGISERVHLDADARCLACSCRPGDSLDLVQDAFPKEPRPDEQLPEDLRRCKAGDGVEHVGDVSRDLLVCGEQPEVFVARRVGRVIVAGADVDVSAYLAALAPR